VFLVFADDGSPRRQTQKEGRKKKRKKKEEGDRGREHRLCGDLVKGPTRAEKRGKKKRSQEKRVGGQPSTSDSFRERNH